MRQTSVINDLLSTITDNRLFGERRKPRRTSRSDLALLIESLLNGRGESSSLERAAEFLRAYRDLDSAGRTFVFRTLASDYGPEPERLAQAAKAYLDMPNGETAKAVQRAAEPRRVEIFRRLNQVQGGTQALVAMRCELIDRLANHPDLAPVDDDLQAPVRRLVQPRLPDAAGDQLADLRRGAGKDHPLRGRPRDHRLERPAPAHRRAGPAPVRLLPPATGRRAADLRGSGADERDPARHRSDPVGQPRAHRPRERHHGGVLLHLQLPGRSARHLVRLVPHQAGGDRPCQASCRT